MDIVPPMELFQSIMEKDILTARHSMHVAYLFKNSVSALGLKQNIQHAYIAGLFHDIGKINAPDVIFSGKTPLSPDEYNLVKKHPVDSFRILTEANIPIHICEIALLHHEREDGSGYPYGIRENCIPPEVKLITIVDSFCAIVERRAYRNPVSIQKAMELLCGCSEKYYSDMLNCFLNHIISIYKVALLEIARDGILYK